MKWKDEFATGVERVDRQHKMLFRVADDYREAIEQRRGESSYRPLLDFLEDYSKSHFRFEERCMVERRCPVAHKNKAAHDVFLTVLRDFQQRYSTNGFRIEDAHELVDTVDDWLASHICRIDVHLKNC